MTALARCAPTLTLALLAACAEPERATPREIVHPVAEHLLSANARALGVLRLDSARVQALPFAGADELGERRFGASTGSEQEVFGEIVSAELLPSGRVLLLDASSGLIRVLGATGVSGVVGGVGEGPGELIEPTRLFSHRDSLLVLDAERSLHLLTLAEGALPTYVRTVPLPFAVEDACSTPQGVLVLAAPIRRGDDGRPALDPSRGSLHRLDADGQVVTSFHVPYRATSATVLRALEAYAEIPIRFVEVHLSSSVELAADHGMYAYDAYLLTCAQQHRMPILTLDVALARVASTIGVNLVLPLP